MGETHLFEAFSCMQIAVLPLCFWPILKFQFSLPIASIDDEWLHHKKGKVTTSTHMD
jgi:hypothetical protein